MYIYLGIEKIRLLNDNDRNHNITLYELQSHLFFVILQVHIETYRQTDRQTWQTNLPVDGQKIEFMEKKLISTQLKKMYK